MLTELNRVFLNPDATAADNGGCRPPQPTRSGSKSTRRWGVEEDPRAAASYTRVGGVHKGVRNARQALVESRTRFETISAQTGSNTVVLHRPEGKTAGMIDDPT